MLDPKQRFSTRVDNYIRYRPGYPAGVIEWLKSSCGLRPESRIADVGSGTGILSRLFLAAGNTVLAIEPNPEMRQAGELLLGTFTRFQSVTGSTEETTLAD